MLAVGVAATMPSGLLEASGPQNNFVVTLWLASFALLVLEGLERDNATHPVRIGAALGLAFATKSQAYLFALPFAVWYGVVKLWRAPRSVPRTAAVIAAIALTLNAGIYARNLRWFGGPFGPVSAATNRRIGVDVIVSNMIRNASFHLGTSPELSQRLETAIVDLHSALGMHANDPATTQSHFTVVPMNTSENTAGNLIHFLAGLVCFPLVFIGMRLRRDRKLVTYTLMILVAYVLLCAVLRWSIAWQRLQLTLFVWAAPVIGVSTGLCCAGTRHKSWPLGFWLQAYRFYCSTVSGR